MVMPLSTRYLGDAITRIVVEVPAIEAFSINQHDGSYNIGR